MDQFWGLLRERMNLHYEYEERWINYDYTFCRDCNEPCSHVMCTLSNGSWIQLDMMETMTLCDLTILFPNDWPADTQVTLLQMLVQDIVAVEPVPFTFQGKRPPYAYCSRLDCFEFVESDFPFCSKHMFASSTHTEE